MLLATTLPAISKRNPSSKLRRIYEDSLAKNLFCTHPSCSIKPISRCSKCFEYYCYEHAYGHIHTMENFEIL